MVAYIDNEGTDRCDSLLCDWPLKAPYSCALTEQEVLKLFS